MTWCIDQVKTIVHTITCPRAGGCSRLNRDAPILLFLKEVHGRSAMMNLTHFVGLPGVIEHAFGHRGFTRVDMGTNPKIA